MTDAHVTKQHDHYGRIADTYVGKRIESEAYRFSLNVWASRLLGPWIDGTSQKEREMQVVLDPMCGHGALAPFILKSGARVLLNDLSPEMVSRIAPEIRRDVVVLGPSSVSKLSLESNSIDVVVIAGGLHHVHQFLPEVLREIRRVLKPGGEFLFFEPSNEFFLVRWLRDFIYRFNSSFDGDTERAFRHSEIKISLRGAGFVDVDIRPFGSLAYILMGQPGVVPLLTRSKSKLLFSILLAFDRFIEKIPLLNKTCFAFTGSAKSS